MDGDQIIGEVRGNGDTLHYIYGLSGVEYLVYNDTNVYWVMKNLQGDVIGLAKVNADGSATVVCRYTYTAFGELLSVVDAYGDPITDPTHIAFVNPLRYRSYYFDDETGFYYVSSRYYDPEIGRWINADNRISGVGGDVLGYNMFAYCMNNPVNMSDPSGNWPRWITATVGFFAGGVVISTIAYIAQSHHYDKRKAKNINVPENYDKAMEKEGADNTINASCHQFTAGDQPNKKVCWPDGTEGIYNSDGEWVSDLRDVGTYNFSVPNGGWSSVWHGIVDVLPWIIFGNDDDDTTWMYQRVISFIQGRISNEKN